MPRPTPTTTTTTKATANMRSQSTLLPIDEPDGEIDELQTWYLARAKAEGWVYTSVLRQLMNRMYRDRDYLARRSQQGKRTAYDYAVERDQKALAWTVQALVRHTPSEEKAQAEPPKAPRKPSRRLTAAERERTRGRPSWNGEPKRDWAGPELPDLPPARGRSDRVGRQ